MELKKESKTKKNCAGAKKYPTKGKAYEAFCDKSNTEGVYLVEEIINGQIKHTPYGKCCNSVQDNDLCHIHENQRKKEKSVFLYFEKDIKSKCDGTKIKKANSNMHYFKTMGDRGRNKTLSVTYHDFKTIDDPIFKIIKMDKNPKLINELRLFANQLLKTQNIVVKHVPDESNEKEEKKEETVSRNKELLATIERLNEEHKVIEKKLKNDEDNPKSEYEDEDIKSEDDENIESEDENIDSDDNDLKLEKNDDLDEEINNSDIDDDINDDDSGIACEEIYTTKGKLLYLEPESMSVIEPEGENEGESIGILYKIEKKYGTIIKDNCYYTVLSQNKISYDEVEYFKDVLNNRIFDDNLVFKGRVTKKSDSEYKFHFD
jgi:hypothetical protein|tara:strand:+ start:4464 stop:5588 length:1125 start_codon:yes stop_codon:yes gene_type:complete